MSDRIIVFDLWSYNGIDGRKQTIYLIMTDDLNTNIVKVFGRSNRKLKRIERCVG